MKRNLPPFAAIRAFEATARHGSMQVASEELLLTPSAISHQVKALEVFLGTALFERAPGQLTLTSVGSAYLKDLRQALDLLEASTARASRRGETNHITIHMFHSLAELWFVPMLKDFYRDYPDMQISVVSDPAAADFASGIADVSVIYERIPAGEENRFLFADEMVPCCSDAFLQEHGPITSPASILDFPLIWCDSDPEEWQTWFEHAGLGDRKPHRWIGFDLRAGALQAAREGLGIAMGRRPYADLTLGRPRLVKPVDLIAATGCGYRLAVPQRAEHLAKVKLFTSWLTRASRMVYPRPEPVDG
jgi:LysR family glycine cleavage system transcriptional activator